MESETPSPTGDFLDWPIAPIAPPGYSRNLDNPSNKNELALGIVVTCIIVSTVLSILRVYSRVFVARKVRLEDCKCHQESLLPHFAYRANGEQILES